MKEPFSPRSPASSRQSGAPLLRHFPAEVRDAFNRLAEGNPADGDLVVLAVVKDHIPNKTVAATAVIGDATALIEDLGFDSMAITELVFFFEDLFQVSISNEEILQVTTVGALRRFVHSKLARSTAGGS